MNSHISIVGMVLDVLIETLLGVIWLGSIAIDKAAYVCLERKVIKRYYDE